MCEREDTTSWYGKLRRSSRRCRLSATLLTAMLVATGAHAATSTISIDLAAETVEPANPQANTWGHNAVVIRVTELPSGVEREALRARLDLPVLKGGDGAGPTRFATDSLSGGELPLFRLPLTVRLLPCSDWGLNKAEQKLRGAAGQLEARCGISVRNSPASVTVYSNERNLPIGIVAVDEGAITREHLAFALQLESAPWFIDWSAGFNFLRIRDQRFRADSADGSETGTLKSVTSVDDQYEFASFVHVMPYAWRGAFGFALGLSTEVPTDSLNISLGFTARARTFPSGNAAYVTVGIAYAKRDRLHPDFEGTTEVPAGLSADRLVEGRYGLVPFVGLTFGFFGGQDRFTGVYPGNAKGKD